MGYRREYQVEARGEVAVRGSIVDVYPSTADHPVRIDLWGDEVDRLSRVLGRRPAFARRRRRDVRSSRCASCSPPTRCARAPPSCSQTQPWGREQWERLAEGQTFDGMESWLPWLTRRRAPAPRSAAERARSSRSSSPAACATAPRSCSTRRRRSRRRSRPRGARDLDADAAPRLSLPFDRLLAHTKAQTGAGARRARQSRHARARRERVRSGRRRRRRRSAGASTRCEADGFRVIVAAEGTGLEGAASRQMLVAEVGAPRRRRSSRRSIAASCCPAHQLALVAEADLTGRRRVHRTPRGAREGHRLLRRARPGDFVVHRVHGVGRYLGMETREMFGVTRDRLVVEFKGGDRVYVDSEDIGLIRKYTGGEDAEAVEDGRRRLGEDARAACASAVRDIAARARRALPHAARDARPRVRARHAVAARRSRTRSRTRRRPTSSRRSTR